MSVTLSRRFAAIFYDSLLLLSVLFISTLVILPLITNQAIESSNIVYKFYLLIISYLYYFWQWQHGGQTLGMKSWKIKLISLNNNAPQSYQLTLRFLAAIVSWSLFGFGYIWYLFDKDKLTLHDRLSATKLILIE